MMQVRNITLELAQTLPSGEEQTLIVEFDGETATMSTENWTQGALTLPDIIDIADIAYARARVRLEGKQ